MNTSEKGLVWLAAVLFLYMPFHLFLSRWLSQYTGGLMVWETAKDFITIATLIISIVVAFRLNLFRNRTFRYFTFAFLTYGLTHLIFLIDPLQDKRAIIMGALYNCRVFAYFYIATVVGYLIRDKDLKQFFKYLLIITTIVSVFGIAQYFLPKDLMNNYFGYSIERGARPSFFIDDKPNLPRVMSTIRDPNSLGAFLVLPLSLMWAALQRPKEIRRRTVFSLLFLTHLLALLLTFSRSALLGLLLSFSVITSLVYGKVIVRVALRYIWILSACFVLLCSGLYLARDNYFIQNVVFHSDEQTVEADPNEKRIEVYQTATQEIIRKPEGHGPGSAGPIAFSNRNGGLITENYYLQIAYEVGILGLVVFLFLMLLILRMLLQNNNNVLTIALIGSFLGLALSAMFGHLWSNESVAALFLMGTGVVLGCTHFRKENYK